MTYNVFSGTLNPTQSITLLIQHSYMDRETDSDNEILISGHSRQYRQNITALQPVTLLMTVMLLIYFDDSNLFC